MTKPLLWLRSKRDLIDNPNKWQTDFNKHLTFWQFLELPIKSQLVYLAQKFLFHLGQLHSLSEENISVIEIDPSSEPDILEAIKEQLAYQQATVGKLPSVALIGKKDYHKILRDSEFIRTNGYQTIGSSYSTSPHNLIRQYLNLQIVIVPGMEGVLLLTGRDIETINDAALKAQNSYRSNVLRS